jgi:hypothetical protein
VCGHTPPNRGGSLAVQSDPLICIAVRSGPEILRRLVSRSVCRLPAGFVCQPVTSLRQADPLLRLMQEMKVCVQKEFYRYRLYLAMSRSNLADAVLLLNLQSSSGFSSPPSHGIYLTKFFHDFLPVNYRGNTGHSSIASLFLQRTMHIQPLPRCLLYVSRKVA